MKNLIKGIAFSLVMFLGMGSINAQSLSQEQKSPEVIAKKATENLSTLLELDGDQQRAVFRALVVKENNYTKNVYGKDLKDAAVSAAKRQYDQTLEESMKKVLSDKQFQAWKGLKNQ